MKTLIKTSIFVIALAGIMAYLAGSALAAPAPAYEHAPWQDDMLIDPDIVRDLSQVEVINPGGPFPDAGDDECAGCDDGAVDDGSDEGVDEGDDGGDEGVDEGDDEGVVDEEQTPPVDENDDSGKTDEQQTPPTTNQSSGKKLPNTGTQLAIIGGIGFLVALSAFGARKALKKKMQ